VSDKLQVDVPPKIVKSLPHNFISLSLSSFFFQKKNSEKWRHVQCVAFCGECFIALSSSMDKSSNPSPPPLKIKLSPGSKPSCVFLTECDAEDNEGDGKVGGDATSAAGAVVIGVVLAGAAAAAAAAVMLLFIDDGEGTGNCVRGGTGPLGGSGVGAKPVSGGGPPIHPGGCNDCG
jgi:hypothetical protein